MTDKAIKECCDIIKIKECCDIIKSDIHADYIIANHTKTAYSGLPIWIKAPYCQFPSFAFKPSILPESMIYYVYNPKTLRITEFSWAYPLILDCNTKKVFYYENLDYYVDTSWHDLTSSRYLSESAIKISGEYTTKDFNWFKSKEQLISFCKFHYTKINKKYNELCKGLEAESIKFWSIKNKQYKTKKINKLIKQIDEDF